MICVFFHNTFTQFRH